MWPGFVISHRLYDENDEIGTEGICEELIYALWLYRQHCACWRPSIAMHLDTCGPFY